MRPDAANNPPTALPIPASSNRIMKVCFDRPAATLAAPTGRPIPKARANKPQDTTPNVVTIDSPPVRSPASGARRITANTRYDVQIPAISNMAVSIEGDRRTRRRTWSEYVGRKNMPAPLATVSAGAIRRRAASRIPTASRPAVVATIMRTNAWLAGRSPTCIERQLANAASSPMRDGDTGPRSNSTRGSWTIARPIATIDPASNEMITVSSVSAASLAITAPSNPSEPSAKAASLATSVQNSRRAIRILRSVSSIAQPTEAMANRTAVVAPTPSTSNATAQVSAKMTTMEMVCDWNRARRIPGSKRSSTVSESPIQPVCKEFTVIRTAKSRLNVPRVATPSCRRTTSAISRLVPATISCDTTAPRGRPRMVSSRVRGRDGRTRRRSGLRVGLPSADARCRGHAHRYRARRSS